MAAATHTAAAAASAWSAIPGYRRGQLLYQVAGLLEERLARLGTEPAGGSPAALADDASAALDRWVWYTGWADKIGQMCGPFNLIEGAHFSCSTPTPIGVVGVVAPRDSTLLELVNAVAPIIVTGSTAIVLIAQHRSRLVATLTEILTLSDLPVGVATLLSGNPETLGPRLALDPGVDAIDLAGVSDQETVIRLEALASAGGTRVLHYPADAPGRPADPGIQRMAALFRTKTIWSSRGF